MQIKKVISSQNIKAYTRVSSFLYLWRKGILKEIK